MTETPPRPALKDAFTRVLLVQGKPVLTDSEGYLRDLSD